MKEDSAKLKVTDKGQVTFRRSILDHLGVRPGEKLVVDLLPGGRAEVRAAPRGSIEAFIGCLARPGETPLSDAELKEAIEAAWAGEP